MVLTKWDNNLSHPRPLHLQRNENMVIQLLCMDVCSFNTTIVIYRDSKHSNKPGYKREGMCCLQPHCSGCRSHVNLYNMIRRLIRCDDYYKGIMGCIFSRILCNMYFDFAELRMLPEERLERSLFQRKSLTILSLRLYRNLHGLIVT